MVSMTGLKTASTSTWSFFQWNSTSFRLDTWCPFVTISCATTLELALDGCSKSFIFETTTTSKLPGELPGNLLSFYGRDHSQSKYLNLVQIWETSQYRCWRLIKSFCFTVDWECMKRAESVWNEWEWKWINEFLGNCVNHWDSTRLCHKWKDFYFFWLKFGGGWLWLAEKFFQKRRWFFFVVTTPLFDNAMCAIATKYQNCRFFVLQWSI